MTELLTVLPAPAVLRRSRNVHLIFIRRDPESRRAYRIYANLFPKITPMDQWGAPYPVLCDNIPDLKNWMYISKTLLSEANHESKKD